MEKLQPIMSEDGGVADWKTSSSRSMSLRKKISTQLAMKGYRTISFKELVDLGVPQSALVVSTFYTLPYDVKGEADEVTDKATLVLIKTAVFDENLDPKSKKDVINVDGLTKVTIGKEFPDPVTRSVKEAFGWFADNSSGTILLD